jgi:L-iditol 2-dehydrogenase
MLVAPFEIELIERELPAPSSSQVLLRVDQCGVCASEIDVWTGKEPEELPAAIGHEAAGIVERVGDDVRGIQPGDHVAVWVDGGGFADRLLVEERFCIPVAADAPYPAVAEPLSCIVNAVELAAPRLGDDVVIVGAGYMGNLLQLVAALKGPRTITVADVRPDALARAERLGATRVIDTSQASLADAVRDVSDGGGADVSFEVTGAGAGLQVAAEATRMSGKLCIVGYHQGGARTIQLGRWNWMAFEIVNAHFRELETIMRGMRAGMRLVSAGVLDPSGLVTDAFPLGRVADAFHAATEKRNGFVKALVEPAADSPRG